MTTFERKGVLENDASRCGSGVVFDALGEGLGRIVNSFRHASRCDPAAGVVNAPWWNASKHFKDKFLARREELVRGARPSPVRCRGLNLQI